MWGACLIVAEICAPMTLQFPENSAERQPIVLRNRVEFLH